VARFYTEGLGLMVPGSITDHEGFDGVMVGLPGAPFHPLAGGGAPPSGGRRRTTCSFSICRTAETGMRTLQELIEFVI